MGLGTAEPSVDMAEMSVDMVGNGLIVPGNSLSLHVIRLPRLPC